MSISKNANIRNKNVAEQVYDLQERTDELETSLETTTDMAEEAHDASAEALSKATEAEGIAGSFGATLDAVREAVEAMSGTAVGVNVKTVTITPSMWIDNKATISYPMTQDGETISPVFMTSEGLIPGTALSVYGSDSTSITVELKTGPNVSLENDVNITLISCPKATGSPMPEADNPEVTWVADSVYAYEFTGVSVTTGLNAGDSFKYFSNKVGNYRDKVIQARDSEGAVYSISFRNNADIAVSAYVGGSLVYTANVNKNKVWSITRDGVAQTLEVISGTGIYEQGWTATGKED